MLRVWMFGGVSVALEGRPARGAGTQRKPLALLALLAAAGEQGLSRDKLLLYLWPECDEEHGRNTLRQTLHALRRDLGEPLLFAGTSELRLDPGSATSDVGDFLAALVRGDAEAAAAAYAGPFLYGFHLPDAPEFERWAEVTRHDLAGRARTTFEQLAAQATRRRDAVSAGEWWLRAASVGSPTATPSHQTSAPAVRLAGQIRVAATGVALAVTAAVVFPLLWDGISGAMGVSRTTLDPALLAVAPFEVFDPALAVWQEGLVDLLARDLDGLGRLHTVSPSVVLRRWQGSPDPESASRLGRATGARLVLFGSLLGTGGDSVRLAGTLIDAATGGVIADLERRDQAARIDRLTDSVTLAVLHALDPALSAGARPGGGLRSVSLESLKLFLREEQFFRQTRWDSARAYYERATARDPSFALAYRRLGGVLSWSRVSYDSLASSYLLRAGSLNHGLGARDSVLLRADSLTAAVNITADELTSWNLSRELLRTVREATLLHSNDPEAWFAMGESGYHTGAGPLLTVPESEVL
nr:hypothetical protein [Gemmatimonadales bacterium]